MVALWNRQRDRRDRTDNGPIAYGEPFCKRSPNKWILDQHKTRRTRWLPNNINVRWKVSRKIRICAFLPNCENFLRISDKLSMLYCTAKMARDQITQFISVIGGPNFKFYINSNISILAIFANFPLFKLGLTLQIEEVGGTGISLTQGKVRYTSDFACRSLRPSSSRDKASIPFDIRQSNSLVMAALRGRCGHSIFSLCYTSLLFFPTLIFVMP